MRKMLSIFAFILISAVFLTADEKYFQKYKGTPKEGFLIEGVKYYKQKKRTWCGPAVLQMMLDFYGQAENQKQIAASVFDESEKVVKLSEMLFYLREKGLQSFSFIGDLERIKELLSKNIPVIVFQKAAKDVNKGHFRLVIGYDYEKNLLIFHDPLLGEKICLKENDFLQLWKFRDEEKWSAIAVKDLALLKTEYLNNDIFFRDMATAYFRRGKLNEAELYWRKALEISPKPRYLYSLAYTLLKLNNLTEAEKYAQLALNQDPENPFVLSVNAEVEYNKGNVKGALEMMKKAQNILKTEYFQKRISEWEVIVNKEGKK